MRKIVDYLIADAIFPGEAIAQGMEPYGFPVVNGTHIMQAFVKYEDEAEKPVSNPSTTSKRFTDAQIGAEFEHRKLAPSDEAIHRAADVQIADEYHRRGIVTHADRSGGTWEIRFTAGGQSDVQAK